MKKIFLSIGLFCLVFLGFVAISYQLWIQENIVIIGLFVLYALFQLFLLWRAYKYGRDWVIAGIFLQALLAVLSPLYFSNFWDPVYEYTTGTWFDSENAFYPCQLCWWARIMMFPILPLSLFALFSRSKAILRYIHLVTIPGILLELFHYVLQKPQLIGSSGLENPFWCTDANPCSALEVDYFGILTIPFLAFLAFLTIHILVSFALFSKKIEKATK